ncbi:MAG: YbhB/YbcL family Raf kinase inhibitor-like protein [Kosmotogaceae bacterium]
MALIIKSDFGEGETIPAKFTCEGEDVSPLLKIEGIDEKASSLAIVVDDPDAPMKTFVHWVAWNIEPTNTIPEGIPTSKEVTYPINIVQGRNDGKGFGYMGPCPPKGHGVHHYHFKVYALDAKLDLKPGSSKRKLLKAIKDHIIDQAELVGTYERK